MNYFAIIFTLLFCMVFTQSYAEEQFISLEIPTQDSLFQSRQPSAGDLVESAARNYTLSRIISFGSVTTAVLLSYGSTSAKDGLNSVLLVVGGQIVAFVINLRASDKLKKAGQQLNAEEWQRRKR